MIDLKSKSMCSGCSACKNICPRNAIKMVEDNEGFSYPVVDSNLCVNCGLCIKSCPINQSKEQDIEKDSVPKAYAVYNKNEDIRMKSSSGGVFTELAKEIIKNNGIVFGAVFDEDFNVFHDEINNEKDLEKIRGSKYIQSNINNTYAKAKQYLEEGKEVLFTGTPCQIEGLYSFLRKNYENLYTHDLICHGVPSKKAWRKYLEYREKVDGQKPEKIEFRNKEKSGWSNYIVTFSYKQAHVDINHEEDLFMKIFLSDIALRPSCYECKFKKINRKADITIADFWGINNVMPSMNDEKGTSLMIIHSQKGEKLFKKIIDRIEYKEVDFFQSIKSNQNMIKSANIENRKEELFNDLDSMDIEKIVEKYVHK